MPAVAGIQQRILGNGVRRLAIAATTRLASAAFFIAGERREP
jgi:hypothetical protein